MNLRYYAFWKVIDEKSSIVKKLSFEYSFINEQM